MYYSTTDVSSLDEQLAPAFQLGLDNGISPKSRFCKDYFSSLKHGSASVDQTIYAVVWSDFD